MRIRTIKPEWLDDERLATCSSDARVLSVALITLADDAGRGRYGATIAARVFPLDPTWFYSAFAELEPWYVTRYEVREQTYFAIANFSKHQRIDPRRFRVLTPEPGEPGAAGAAQVQRRCSAAAPRDRDQDQDQDQDQDIGTRVSPETPKPARKVRAPRLAPGLVEELFSYWQKAFGHERSKLDDKRARLLRAALRQYGMVDCKLVCDGVKRSPYHMGQNENQIVYDKISLLYRDGEHIEKYRGWATSPPKGAGYRDEIDELIARTKKGR